MVTITVITNIILPHHNHTFAVIKDIYLLFSSTAIVYYFVQ